MGFDRDANAKEWKVPIKLGIKPETSQWWKSGDFTARRLVIGGLLQAWRDDWDIDLPSLAAPVIAAVQWGNPLERIDGTASGDLLN